MLRLAAIADAGSPPLSRAIAAAYADQATEELPAATIQEIAGQGVCALVGDQRILLGSAHLVRAHQISVKGATVARTAMPRRRLRPWGRRGRRCGS